MKNILIILIAFLAFQPVAEAQILDKVKRKVVRKKDREEDKAIDKGIESVGDIFKKNDKNKSDDDDSDTAETGNESSGGPVVEPNMSKNKQVDIWMKRYDFKPGREIIFYDDFENEEMGEIPSKWYYNKGLMEIIQVGGEHNNVMSGDLGYGHPNWEDGYTLPEAYTIEFDVFMADPDAKPKGYGSYHYALYFYDEDYQHNVATISLWHAAMELRGKIRNKVPNLTASDLANSWNHISISVNGNSIKGYFNEFRVFNTRIDDDRMPILFTMWNCCQTTEKPVFMIDNFKVSAGAHPKYREEILEGRIVTNNIHFETASAEIIPRSYAEIKRIADVLKKQSDKNFSIEGHTDNVGDDAYNLDLSKRRADAVMNAMKELGIKSSRMSTSGYGEAIPVADNNTPEGRAMNRRVEFIIN